MKSVVTIARQAGVSFAGFVAGQLVRFAYTLVAARLLGADALGVYALVIALVQLGEVAGIAGLDSALLRFVNLQAGEGKKKVIASAMKSAALVSAVVGMLLAAFSGLIAGAFHGGELLRLALCSAGAAIPLSVLTLLSGHAIQAFRQLMPKVVATQLIAPSALLALMVAVRYGAGKEAALIVPFVPAALIPLVWIWPKLRKVTGIGAIDLRRARIDRRMFVFALPLMAVSLFSMASYWIDIVMLGFFSDTRTVGLYQPAARTAGMIRAVLPAFAGIAAPMIAEYHGRGKIDDIRRLHDLLMRWMLLLAIPPALLLMILPEPVLGMFGKGFEVGSLALVMLSAASLLHAGFGIGNTILVMSGNERMSFANQAMALLLQAILHLLLIPLWGMNGAALSTLVVAALLTVVRSYEIRSLLDIRMSKKTLWKPLAAGILAGAALFAARPCLAGISALQGVLAGAATVMLVYAVMIRMFRLEQEELDVIIQFMPFLKK